MKSLLRNTLINSFALGLVEYFIKGLTINGGWFTYILSGFLLALLLITVKPVLNILRFPLNYLTLGIYSLFTNALILYILTVFVPDVHIEAFTTPGFNFIGFIVPSIAFNAFFGFLFTAVVLSAIISFIKWIME